MARPAQQVQIKGARELRRALNKIDRDLGKQLRRALKDEVAEPAAAKIRSRVPRLTGRWSSKITAGASQSSAYVTWGRSTVPYAGPVEHGGYPAGRPFVKEGRYVWPTAKELDPQIEDAALRVFDRVSRAAGF